MMAFLRQRSGRWSLRGYRSKLRQVATLATLNFPPVSYLVTQPFLELGFSSLCFSPSLLETELCMRGAPSWGCVTCSSHATPGRRSTRQSANTVGRIVEADSSRLPDVWSAFRLRLSGLGAGRSGVNGASSARSCSLARSLSIALSLSLSLSLNLPLSVYVSRFLSRPLSVSLFLSLSLSPSLSVCLSLSRALYQSLSLFFCLTLSLSLSYTHTHTHTHTRTHTHTHTQAHTHTHSLSFSLFLFLFLSLSLSLL